MPTYTENYSLHQWEDTDDFLRSDFNEDFSKIDTGLASLKTNIATNGYNIYNLMLQNYYEGKYTGYKQALLFDGFMDDSGITYVSSELAVRTGSVTLSLTGQSSITCSGNFYASVNNTAHTSPSVTVEGEGTLTSITVYANSGSSSDAQTIRYYFNNLLQETGTIYYANISGDALTWTLETPLHVAAGDTLMFQVSGSTTSANYLIDGSSYKLAGVLNITPYGGEEGSLTAEYATDIDWRTGYLWIRHSGGTITPTVNQLAMTQVTQRDSYTLDNLPCVETQWAITQGDGEDITLAFTLACGEDSLVTFYDYGFILI